MSIELIRAISSGDIKIVKKMIDAGENINKMGKGNNLPIVVASTAHTPKGLAVLKLLIDRGADVNKVDDGNGFTDTTRTALLAAVAERNIEGVKLLLDAGADPSAPNNSGLTPLHVASDVGSYEIVKMLLASGANVSAENKYNRIPLNLARGYYHPDRDITAILKAWPAVRNTIQAGRVTHSLPSELQGEVASYLSGVNGQRGVQYGPRIPGVDTNYVGDQLREIAPPLENIDTTIQRARVRLDPEFSREQKRNRNALRLATTYGGRRKTVNKLHRKRHSFSRRKLRS